MAIDTQQIESAERFRKLLRDSGESAKPILLYGGSVEIAKIFEDKKDGTEIAQIISDRDAYQAVESATAAANQRNPKETKKDQLDQSTAQATRSVGGAATAVPAAIYSYFFGNPDRYSAEQLENAANKSARNEIEAAEKAARKAKKNITDQERDALFDKARMDFHEDYLIWHRKRALELAKTSSNPYLLAAIENEKNRKEVVTKERSLFQKTPVFQKKIIGQTGPEISELTGKDLSFSSEKIQSRKLIGGQTIPSTTPAARPGFLSRFSNKSRAGRGIQNPLNKIANPLSLLRRFLLPISITTTLISVVLFTAIITFFFFDIGSVAGGTGSEQSGRGITPISIADVKTCVIIEQGGSAETITDEQKNFIYEAFSLPLGSKTYNKLLCSTGPIHLYFYPADIPGAVDGGANYGGNGTMKYMGFFEFLGSPSKATQRRKDMLAHMLVHESGHIIDRRNGELGYNRASLASQDSSCYNNHNKTTNVSVGQVFISTYAYRDNGKKNDGSQDTIGAYDSHSGEYILEDVDHGTVNAESFAESIANNVFCKPGEGCDKNNIYSSTPIVYNGKCTATYNWIEQNIFGGDDFFAKPGNANMCDGYYASADERNSSVLTNCSLSDCPKNIYLHKGENFGDPQCELANKTEVESEDIINSTLKQLDPNNVAAWDQIITCESNYHPLDFAPNSHSTFGAYGMLQMNPKTNPYTGYSRGSANDIGDVAWEDQLKNAVDRSKNIGGFGYWSCGSGLIRQ